MFDAISLYAQEQYFLLLIPVLVVVILINIFWRMFSRDFFRALKTGKLLIGDGGTVNRRTSPLVFALHIALCIAAAILVFALVQESLGEQVGKFCTRDPGIFCRLISMFS